MFRRTFTILTALLILVSTIALLPPALGDIQRSFSDDVLVSGEDPLRLVQKNPAIAVAPDGNISVVWEEYDDYGSPSIYFAISDDGGATFSEKMMINESGEDQAEPKIAVNSSGVIFVTWTEAGSNGPDIMFTMSSDSGNSFHPVIEVAAFTEVQRNPDIATSGEMVYIAWAQENVTNFDIMFARSVDGGLSFLPAFKADDCTTNTIQNYPSVAAQEDLVFLAWHDSRDDPYLDIYGAWSNDSGASFIPNLKVSDGLAGYRQSQPDAAFQPSGEVTVAWQDDREGDLDIRASTSSGDSFLPSVRVDDSSPGNDQSYPSVAVDSLGNVSVVFRDERTDEPHISWALSRDGGSSFSSSVRVDDEEDSAFQGAPDVAIGANDTPMVVFEDYRGENWNIMFSKMLNAPPFCEISSPEDGDVLVDWVTFMGNATDPDDNDSLLDVEVRLVRIDDDYDSGWMVIEGNVNWSFDFNTSTVLNGEYRFEARSYDGRAYSNIVSITVTIENEIQLWPDLAFEGNITFSPTNFEMMKPMIISVEVTNLGNETAKGVEVQFLRGNVEIGELEIIPKIEPGETKTSYTFWNALQGLHTIKVILDPDDKIEELNENNNQIMEQIQVMPAGYYRSDLNISDADLSIVPTDLKDGDQAVIAINVHNDGRVNASDVKVLLMLDGDEVANGTIEEIVVNETASMSFNWTAEEGEHEIQVLLDPQNSTSELDETNNNASINVDVAEVGAIPGWYLWVTVIAILVVGMVVVVMMRRRRG
ncbi:MAG TPA: CARDB domain-containing protein [Methanomassiliicoccales archaeon]|nr:CARDB domain-containing protein [Methanomassiliicoccales archaeon]